MARSCHTFDHTADVGLEARADTLGELFEALAEGLADFICPRKQVSASQERAVSAAAEDVEALAVDFLTEVMLQIQTERFAVASVKVKGINENSVSAELLGEPLQAGRHEVHTEVKAVTYHQLAVKRSGEGWVGRVILDL